MSSPQKIVVVDDDKDMREMLAQSLEKSGYDVKPVEDGEALDEVLHTPDQVPDVIVTDLLMPKRDGFTVLCEIRVRFPQIHVILITAFGSDQTHLRAKKLGAAAVLNKPFDVEELKEIIAKLD